MLTRSNPAVLNRLGRPVAYALSPQGRPTLLAAETSSIARRAAFATKHLWVTRCDSAERYPAGDYVNQSHGQDGLPAWVARDRDIDGEDVGARAGPQPFEACGSSYSTA
jgi:primary-amine oxidase